MNTKLIAILAIATLSIALPSIVFGAESFEDFCKRKSGGSISAADFICAMGLEQMHTDLKKNTLEIEDMRSMKIVKTTEYVKINAGDELLVQDEIQYYTVACPNDYVIEYIHPSGSYKIGTVGVSDFNLNSLYVTYYFKNVEEGGNVTITIRCEGISFP